MEVIENIQKNVDAFKADTLKLDQFLTGTRISYSFFQQKYPEVQKEFNDKPRSEEEVEGMSLFDNLNDSVPIYEKEIFKYCFINIIARTDAFLNDIANSIYLWKKPELREEEREKAILKFSHSSFKNKLHSQRFNNNISKCHERYAFKFLIDSAV